MASEERAAKRKRYTSPIIKLIVGKEKCELTVHKDRLREHSPFFRAALDKRWKEGLTGSIELPEDDVDEVVTYIEWLYDRSEIEIGSEWKFSAGLYTFGERILDDTFCDAVLTAILAGVDVIEEDGEHSYPGGAFAHKLYAGTTSESPARASLVAMYVEQAYEGWSRRHDEFRPEFMFDLLKAMAASREVDFFKSWHERREQWFKVKKQA